MRGPSKYFRGKKSKDYELIVAVEIMLFDLA
jgi:hypothetical protein